MERSTGKCGGEGREMSEGKGQNLPFFEKGLLPIQGGKV